MARPAKSLPRPTQSYQKSYQATEFVESAGAIPFDLSARQVYLVHYVSKNEWLLAKGRRNLHESRAEAALREVHEETGLTCTHLKTTFATRAPAASEPANVGDRARIYDDVELEPFMFTMRHLGGEKGVKLIWWYIAEVSANVPIGDGENAFEVAAFKYYDAIERLAYEGDREVLRQAVEIVEQTFPSERVD
jgi:8-oxo-dGTP pyrophosphatase MutT (NUDIX family)